MKKQRFILLTIVCLFVSLTNQAQNTPIDVFLNKYPSRDGVTNVSMSQQMLSSIFAPQPSKKTGKTQESQVFYTSFDEELNVPEAYGSVTVSKIEKTPDMLSEFRKMLVSSKYEQYMEVNKENSNVLSYYLKKINENNNEIVVLRQQKEQFSAIYIKGDIEIDRVDRYLTRIKMALSHVSDLNDMNFHQMETDLAFNLQSLNDWNMNMPDFNYKFDLSFDSTDMQLKFEKMAKEAEEQIKKVEKEHEEKIKSFEEEVRKMEKQAEKNNSKH